MAKDNNPKKNALNKFLTWWTKPKVRQISGLLLILFALYLFIAFTSFLFTWEYDQDLIIGVPLFKLIINPDIKVENWLGKIGAYVSHGFMHNWFGVSSFVVPFLIFLLGFKILFKFSLLPFSKSFKYSFFFLIWTSVCLSYFFTDNLLFLGGNYGYQLNIFFQSAVGKVGTVFLLIFSLLAFASVNFNLSFNFLGKLFTKNNTNSHDIPESISLKTNNANPLTTENEEFNKKDETTLHTVNETDNSLEIEVDETISPQNIDEIEIGNSNIEVETNDELTPENDEFEITPKIDKIEKSDDDLTLDIEETETDEILSDDEVSELADEMAEYDPTLDLSKYKMPPTDLLQFHGEDKIVINREELETNKNRIVETLGNYNIEISKIKATVGPTVTLYEIIPAPGVRISKIKNLEDDIALSLSALGIRIIAPIPGKGTIGIEVPNQNAEIVSMRTVIASEKFQKSDMALPVALGKTITNETYVVDLAKMPHLLMAGATGQGKSVGLNAILVSLLYKKHPSQVKLVLVDPKKVELTLFNKIERHYLAKLPDAEEAIITDTSKVVNTLNSLCIEMDQRYELLKDANTRNIKEYNAKFVARKLNPKNGHKYLPYIVVVVDEFADLIMTAGKEVEMPIARLAQLARAIGIHLIIATQRPSVNIITGTIKANFPSRIAFRVTSRIDSKTILDTGGADQLIGRGDMLLSNGNDIIRIQCAFVDTPEVEEICNYIGEQQGYPDAFILPEYVGEQSESQGNIADMERDAMFEDAARVVVQNQQGSTSLLQRRLKLGYNRAGRIVDQLEAAGIIGPFEGSKARQVLIPDEPSLERLLESLNQNN